MSFSQGSIFIQLNKPSYSSGEQVDGFIYLYLPKNYFSDTIYMTIRGHEEVKLVEGKWMSEYKYKSSYRYHGRDFKKNPYSRYKDELNFRYDYWNRVRSKYVRTKTTGEGDDEKKEEEKFILLDHYQYHTIINQKFPVYKFKTNSIPAGQYSFPISFRLPSGIPATFNYEFSEYEKFCFGDTFYSITASLESPYRQYKDIRENYKFVINQSVKGSGHTLRSRSKNKITSWCCIDRGIVDLASYFEKSDYKAGEVAKMVIMVDNSKCKADVQKIEGDFQQRLRLRAAGFTKNIVKKLNRAVTKGVKAGEKVIGDKAYRMSLTLANRLTGQRVQPTSQGKLIDNDYILETITFMDATLCCEEHPRARMVANIFNAPIERRKSQLPSNWEPQIMTPFTARFSGQPPQKAVKPKPAKVSKPANEMAKQGGGDKDGWMEQPRMMYPEEDDQTFGDSAF